MSDPEKSAALKGAALKVIACDIFKPSGSNLTLMKSTSFEEKMSKQKHNWEVISCSPDLETKKANQVLKNFLKLSNHSDYFYAK